MNTNHVMSFLLAKAGRLSAMVVFVAVFLTSGCHPESSSYATMQSSGVLALTNPCRSNEDCASTAICDPSSNHCRLMAAGECRPDDPHTCACESTIDCPRFFECRRQSWRPLASCTPY